MKCMQCGTELKTDVAFCTQCGAAVEIEHQDEDMVEENSESVLKEPVVDEMVPVTESEEEHETQDMEQSVEDASESSPTMESTPDEKIDTEPLELEEETALQGETEEQVESNSYCVQCGEELKHGVTFCTSCGHQIGAPILEKTMEEIVEEETIEDPVESKTPIQWILPPDPQEIEQAEKRKKILITTLVIVALLALGAVYFFVIKPRL